ncbi:unnamed protein product [Paramecium octaurelia]|uniref:Protein kinase domain-containing protein n=1 Tax=Paramecium octaurelia TaxID=43137 RepID=A0A8S1V297_PAROT|nr:unnamed protein product [Paramecium octaurelia]
MDFIEEDEIGQLCLTKQFSKEVSLDSFEMNCVIGKGQYAKVLLVRKKDTKHLYALKVLKKSGLKQDARIERNIMVWLIQLRLKFNIHSSQNQCTRSKLLAICIFAWSIAQVERCIIS